MTPSGPNKSHYSIIVGKIRSDGKKRIYATTQGGAMYEYSWNGSKYTDSVILDATTGATACLAIGDGRNDDTGRIYVSNYFEGIIYEVTHFEPWVDGTTNTIPVNSKVSSINQCVTTL